MAQAGFVSIDQNSHSLWDTVPKLQALAANGWTGTHFVEDVDVAFTRRGAAPGDTALALAPERYYRGGTSDWGAALFYTDFLGRNPVDVTAMEPYTGWSSAALARRLECTLDELYDRYSPSDNWQLVGSSYLGDADHHRTIGDLGVAETAPFLAALLEHAERNMLDTFPEADAQQRVRQWFADERDSVKELTAQLGDGRLVDLYQAWLRRHVTGNVGLTSDFFAPREPDAPRFRLLSEFIRNYDHAAVLYNDAIAETGVGLTPLRSRDGELPFFLATTSDGRHTRSPAWLRDGAIVSGDNVFTPSADGALPLEEMRGRGVTAVTGKALLLVLQARLIPGGGPVAVPYNGSLYMPAAHRLEAKLRENGFLPWELAPLVRVKLNVIDQWHGVHTRIRLPAHLASVFGAAELAACDFAEAAPGVVRSARSELDELESKAGRQAIMQTCAAAEFAERQSLDGERRELARDPATRPRAGELWDRIKGLDRRMLERLVDRVLRNLHVVDLDYWNSRGAILPWSIALGGEALYHHTIANAEIYPE